MKALDARLVNIKVTGMGIVTRVKIPRELHKTLKVLRLAYHLFICKAIET